MSTAELAIATTKLSAADSSGTPQQGPVDLQPIQAGATTGGEVIEVPVAGGKLAELPAIEKAVAKLFDSEGRAKKAQKTCEQALAKLTDLDLKTKKGLADATSLKTGVVKERTGAKNDADAIKKRLSELGKAIGAEAEKIGLITGDTEKKLESVIKARKDEIEAEEAEAKRIDQERIAKHQANLESLTAMLPAQEVALAAGPEKIAQQIERVESVPVSLEGWEEFAVEAQMEKTQILAHLRAWHALALAHEAQARQQKLLELSGLVMGVFGKSATDIKAALEKAEAVPTDAQTWGELLPQVEMTKGQTVSMLRQMLTQAEAFEAQQAAVEQTLTQASAQPAEAPTASPPQATASSFEETPQPDAQPAKSAVVAIQAETSGGADECSGCGACTGSCHSTPAADEQGEPAGQAQQPISITPIVATSVANHQTGAELEAATHALAVAAPAARPSAPAAPATTEAANYVKLGEFNADLAVCSVDAEQLSALGFQHQSVPGSKGKLYPKAQRVAIAHALIAGIQSAMTRWSDESMSGQNTTA